jgi:hypothetical protein
MQILRLDFENSEGVCKDKLWYLDFRIGVIMPILIRK